MGARWACHGGRCGYNPPLPSLSGTVFRRRTRVGEIQFEVGQDDPRHRSSVVEHTLGKGEVTSSSLVGGLEHFEITTDGP